ncbi:MAG: hypothetical protein LQ346_004610 [Caloplaca aetnensis]|nr:MAG: hypothetical protein LQ346_004610 [Caloplaca aetnensis]
MSFNHHLSLTFGSMEGLLLDPELTEQYGKSYSILPNTVHNPSYLDSFNSQDRQAESNESDADMVRLVEALDLQPPTNPDCEQGGPEHTIERAQTTRSVEAGPGEVIRQQQIINPDVAATISQFIEERQYEWMGEIQALMEEVEQLKLEHNKEVDHLRKEIDKLAAENAKYLDDRSAVNGIPEDSMENQEKQQNCGDELTRAIEAEEDAVCHCHREPCRVRLIELEKTIEKLKAEKDAAVKGLQAVKKRNRAKLTSLRAWTTRLEERFGGLTVEMDQAIVERIADKACNQSQQEQIGQLRAEKDKAVDDWNTARQIHGVALEQWQKEKSNMEICIEKLRSEKEKSEGRIQELEATTDGAQNWTDKDFNEIFGDCDDCEAEFRIRG